MKKHTLVAYVAMLLAVVLLIAPMESLADQASADTGSAKAVFEPWDAAGDEYVPVVTGEKYVLSVCADACAFAVTEAGSGKTLWSSAMTTETYSELENNSAKWLAYMTSLLAVNYTTKDDTRGNIISAYSASKDTKATVLRGENAVRFEFAFEDIGIGLAMEVTLEGDRLVVDLPAEDVYENGDYVIRSVEVLPFFAGVAKEKNADGYLVYPDGSGAISYFDRVDDKSAFAQPITLDIYDTMNLEDTLSEKKSATASLPVFGIKNNDTAIMAAITKGSENARINVCSAIDNAAVPIHRSAFELFYRNEYRIYLSNIKGATSEVSETYGTKLDKDLQKIDRQVSFFLLQGDEADYSGMATAYRDYLLDEGILTAQSTAQELSLFLTLFMGIEKEGALVDSNVSVTTYEQAASIAEELLGEGVDTLDVLLRGWSAGGYGAYPQSGKAAGNLGGKQGLERLNDLAKAEDGLNVRLETELLYTNKNRYIAVKGTSLAITDEFEKTYLLSPAMVKKQLTKLQKATKKYDSLSLALSTIGNSLYPDYTDARYATRTDTMETWQEVIADDQVTAVQGGNLYGLSQVGYLYDMPDTCSLQQMTDHTIPWYYMIVSGVLPYVTTAGNRTGDLDALKLQWIEYGAMPYFELTEISSKELRDTNYNGLFTSTFDQWSERAVAIYKEMRDNLADVTGQKMQEHTYIGDDQVAVTYENGYRVLINYGEEPFTYDGQTVPAGDYVVYSVKS